MKTVLIIVFIFLTVLAYIVSNTPQIKKSIPSLAPAQDVVKQEEIVGKEENKEVASSSIIQQISATSSVVTRPKKLTPEVTQNKVVLPRSSFTVPITVLPLPVLPIIAQPPISKIASSVPATGDVSSASGSQVIPMLSPPPMPPLNEAALFAAVVKIECPTEDGKGKYIGSGFVLNGDTVLTAAHVVKDSGSRECRVIFPKDRRPIHYLKGTLENSVNIKKRHDEEGIDVAVLTLPPFAEYDDARVIFKTAYPTIPYPLCTNPLMLTDTLLHFGYPSNFLNQEYLSQSKGEAVLYADIQGIENQYSSELQISYKSPILSYTENQSSMHPYMISRVPTFYGDSGGLAFNKTKQCVLGPHRGGTIGGGEGENYSIFTLLGWKNLSPLLDTYHIH